MIYQGSIAEATVATPLNQGASGNCGNPPRRTRYSPAAFCATFFRKKVAEKLQGVLNGSPRLRKPINSSPLCG